MSSLPSVAARVSSISICLEEMARRTDVTVDVVTSSRSRTRYEREPFADRITIYKVPVDNQNIHHATNRELCGTVGAHCAWRDNTAAIMDRPKLVGDAVATWKKHSDGYPGLGRCCTKASAMRRAEAFKAAGFRVGFLDGETPRRERQSLLARLAIGGQRSAHPLGLDVLLFVNVLTEGYDSESSYDLVLHECRSELWQGRSYPPEYVPLCVLGDYAPTKSMGAFIQFWGRGSRVHKDRPWLRLLSHAGNEDEHCFLSAHEGFSLEHKQSEWMAKLRERNIQQGVAVSQGVRLG